MKEETLERFERSQKCEKKRCHMKEYDPEIQLPILARKKSEGNQMTFTLETVGRFSENDVCRMGTNVKEDLIFF